MYHHLAFFLFSTTGSHYVVLTVRELGLKLTEIPCFCLCSARVKGSATILGIDAVNKISQILRPNLVCYVKMCKS